MAQKKDATQEGVSDDIQHNENGEVVGTHTNERLSEIEEIAAARRADRDKPDEDEADEPELEAGDAGGESDTGAADTDSSDADDGSAAADSDDELVTLVVDGQEVKRKKSEVYEAGRRALQKESTADRRLEEATRLLREAEERAKQQPSPSEQDAGKQDQSPSGGPDAIDYKQIVKTIQYGDEDEAAEALQTLIDQGRSSEATQEKPLTRDELTAFLSEKQAFDQAVAEFQKPPEENGYKDLWDDPILRDMVIRKEAEKRDAGDTRPYGELFTEIGSEIREWLDGKTGKSTASQGLKDRQEKLKAQPDTVKGGGGRATSESQQSTQPKSRKQIIEEMAERRGQTA